eukprot:363840_1
MIVSLSVIVIIIIIIWALFFFYICLISLDCSRNRCSMNYSHIMWGIMVSLMALFIIDRFTLNLWPMHFKREIDFQHDDWSDVVYLCIAFVSGRILIISSTFIWILQCRCFFNFFFEHVHASSYKWIFVNDIMHENNTIHYVLGFVCITIPMVIHPWLVFLPLLQDYDLTIFTTWWRPIDPATDFYVENVHHHAINISISDLYALCVCMFVFLVLFPISMHPKFRQRHYALSRSVHLISALIYGIELLRTPFTVHCWFISTPFILLFVCDRIYGICKYRRCDSASIVARYPIDNDYILLLLHIPDIYRTVTHRDIGDVVYLNTKRFSSCRAGCTFAHPFTTFYNHNNAINMVQFTKSLRTSLGDQSHKFPVVTYRNKTFVRHVELDPRETYQFDRNESQSATIERWKYKVEKNKGATEMKYGIEMSDSMEQKRRNRHQRLPSMDEVEEDDEMEWNVGFIVKVHARFTKYLQQMEVTDGIPCSMVTWGPYRSSFVNILSSLIEYKEDEHTEFGSGSIVLIGTGAGCTYIIDFVLWLRDKFESDHDYALSNEIRIHFSCRSIRLFQFVTDFLTEKKYENLSLYAHLTSHSNVYDYDRDEAEAKIDEIEVIKKHKRKRNHARIGRASFQNVLYDSPKHSKVFFSGSIQIQRTISVLCKQLGFQFYEGHSF